MVLVPPGPEASKRLRAPLPSPFLPLPSPDNGGGTGRYEFPQRGTANEIPYILVEI